MSSMVNEAIEMGIDPVQAPGGGTWDNPAYPDYANSRSNSMHKRKKAIECMYLTNHVRSFDLFKDKEICWSTSEEALKYAKDHPGAIITRSVNGKGYKVKHLNSNQIMSAIKYGIL